MLAADPSADTGRTVAVAGDPRLLITRVKNQLRALPYRANVPRTTDAVAFDSPWWSISIDAAEDMNERVKLAMNDAGVFEIRNPKVGETQSSCPGRPPRRRWQYNTASLPGKQSHRDHRRCPQLSGPLTTVVGQVEDRHRNTGVDVSEADWTRDQGSGDSDHEPAAPGSGHPRGTVVPAADRMREGFHSGAALESHRRRA